MIEFAGFIEKIEQSKITNIDIIHMNFEKNHTKMKLDIVNKINPYKENDPVKIIFHNEPLLKENPKLVVDGYLYSITKKEELNKILITISGLQLVIETTENYKDFKARSEFIINFF
jgi:hypothetical protein